MFSLTVQSKIAPAIAPGLRISVWQETCDANDWKEVGMWRYECEAILRHCDVHVFGCRPRLQLPIRHSNFRVLPFCGAYHHAFPHRQSGPTTWTVSVGRFYVTISAQ